MRLFAGIDNGLQGGVVFLDPAGNVVLKSVTPTFKGKNRTRYDTVGMAHMLKGLVFSGNDIRVVLEEARAFPGQGVTSTFTTGYGYGIWTGIVSALEIPFEVLSPRIWQGEMFAGLPTMDGTKAASAAVATRLSPETDWRATERSKNLHDGLTDAFCMAEMCRRRGLGIK